MKHLKDGETPLRIWYAEPAKRFVEALPLGNGRLGAMVYGGYPKERMTLNEDTLWSGKPQGDIASEGRGDLEEVRALIFSGAYKAGQDLLENKMLGPWTESYLPLGEIEIEFKGAPAATAYMRQLDLKTACALTQITTEKGILTMETLVSKPHQIVAIHIKADFEIELELNLKSLLPYKTFAFSPYDLVMNGKCPVHLEPSYVDSQEPVDFDQQAGAGMNFSSQLKVITEGESTTSQKGLRAFGAKEVILLMTTQTGFVDFEQLPKIGSAELNNRCEELLIKASEKSFAQIKSEHITDFQSIFNRVDFNLGPNLNEHIPTDQRIKAVRKGGEDAHLFATYFQYGRYLLMTSSRRNTQPANLQGIWNEELRAPWSSNWTININTEMNYWPAEVCNLSECHEALFDMIEGLSQRGERVAKETLGCRGWVAHHNVDLWRNATPVGGSASWAFWPLGGVWLCQHLWEHYAFTQDKSFLEMKAYPIMKGAARFCQDWLVKDDKGRLHTCPSTSPENEFYSKNGDKCCVSYSSTMDISMIRQLFTDCIEAAKILEVDPEESALMAEMIKQLPPLQIGKWGQVQEWIEDFDEVDVAHRHLSHLWGLYPGRCVHPEEDHRLKAAIETTFERRLSLKDDFTGWSCAWLINLYARMGDAQNAYNKLNTLIGEQTCANLMNAHAAITEQNNELFQIDGNFGGTSGVAEMLLQSHKGSICLLPALPKQWKTGHIQGLVSRGNYEVSIWWEEGKLVKAEIHAHVDGTCQVSYNRNLKLVDEEAQILDEKTIAFQVKKDTIYQLK